MFSVNLLCVLTLFQSAGSQFSFILLAALSFILFLLLWLVVRAATLGDFCAESVICGVLIGRSCLCDQQLGTLH